MLRVIFAKRSNGADALMLLHAGRDSKAQLSLTLASVAAGHAGRKLVLATWLLGICFPHLPQFSQQIQAKL